MEKIPQIQVLEEKKESLETALQQKLQEYSVEENELIKAELSQIIASYRTELYRIGKTITGIMFSVEKT